MHLLQFVLSGEVEDYAAGVTLHWAESSLLEVNLSTEVGCAQQVFVGREEKLGAIRPAAHLARYLLIRRLLRSRDLVCGGSSGCLCRNGSSLYANIAGCDDILHVVLRTKMKSGLLRLHVAGLARETSLVKD